MELNLLCGLVGTDHSVAVVLEAGGPFPVSASSSQVFYADVMPYLSQVQTYSSIQVDMFQVN